MQDFQDGADRIRLEGLGIRSYQAGGAPGTVYASDMPDGSVTLEPIYCLGLCATAPSALLDGRIVGRLDDKRLDALIAETQK